MPDLTDAHLARIAAGATLVATAIAGELEYDGDLWTYCVNGRQRFCGHLGDFGSSEFAPFLHGSPVHPSLPGLTWGKSRTVQCGRLTDTDAASLWGDKKTWITLGYLQRFRKELGDETDWLWLTEVRR